MTYFDIIDGHNIASVRHILFWQFFDIQTDVVATVRLSHGFVMHFDRENIASAARGVKLDIHIRSDFALFDPARNHISDAFDLIHARHWHSKRFFVVSLRRAHYSLQCVTQCHSRHFLFLYFDTEPIPPFHILRFVLQIIAFEARHWNEWDFLRFVTDFG